MKSLDERFEEIEALARRMGLDPFPILYEVVPRDIIWEVSSYGLPTRMSHWSFGRSFVHQKTYGEMGYSKIYELIINNNPSYAFLDDTNSDVVNMLICGHCAAHSDFFKHNACFSKSNRNMVNQAEQNAHTVDSLKEKYGIEVVEDWMDVAFALDRHIDWSMGENRQRYPQQEHVFRKVDPLPYSDLFGEDQKPRVVHEVKNKDFPPHKERDLIWFMASYAQMLPWQRELLSMIRSESFYFYPQFMTKIMNEGWASFWHAELMLNYEDLTPSEHMDFAKAHAGVVSAGPPGSLNPYYVGFRIFGDIKKRWDEYYEAGQKDAAFLKFGDVDKYDEEGNVVMSKMTGMQKLLQVRAEDDDVSFVHNYLTRDLAQDMKLYRYGMRGVSENPDEDDIILKSRDMAKIIEAMTSRLHNYGAPPIYIDEVSDSDRSLILIHDESDKIPLDEMYTKETLKYIARTWGHKVVLRSRDRFGKVLSYVIDGYSEVKSREAEDESIVEVSI